VDQAAVAVKQLGEAKARLHACRDEVEATADSSKQALDPIAKQIRQATGCRTSATTVSCSRRSAAPGYEWW
jgi:hypothetical protein